MKDVRDEILRHPSGQRITQVGQVEYREIMSLFLSGDYNLDALCTSESKKDRTTARKLACMTQITPEENAKLLFDRNWVCLEFIKFGADSILTRIFFS